MLSAICPQKVLLSWCYEWWKLTVEEIRDHGTTHQKCPKTDTDNKYLCYIFYTRCLFYIYPLIAYLSGLLVYLFSKYVLLWKKNIHWFGMGKGCYNSKEGIDHIYQNLKMNRKWYNTDDWILTVDAIFIHNFWWHCLILWPLVR